MSEKIDELKTDELKKLATIAADMHLAADLRTKAMEHIGHIATYEALLVLLNLGANEKLITKERDYALRQARELVKKTSTQ